MEFSRLVAKAMAVGVQKGKELLIEDWEKKTPKRIGLVPWIKALREVTAAGLKEAKAAVEIAMELFDGATMDLKYEVYPVLCMSCYQADKPLYKRSSASVNVYCSECVRVKPQEDDYGKYR